MSSIESKLKDLNIRKRKINQLIDKEIQSIGWESVKTNNPKSRVDATSDFPRFEDFMSQLEKTYPKNEHFKMQDFKQNVNDEGGSSFRGIQELLDKTSILDDQQEKMSNSSGIISYTYSITIF